METIIVVLIVVVALFYVIRKLIGQFKGKGSCSSGCSCSATNLTHCQSLKLPDFKSPDK